MVFPPGTNSSASSVNPLLDSYSRARRRVASVAVVKHLDTLERVLFRGFSYCIALTMDLFDFQGLEKALDADIA